MNFAPTEEQLMVKDMVRKFAESQIKPVAAELDHTHRHPEEICRKLGEMGIMGVSVPTEYGGAGMDNITYVMAMIEISKACASLSLIHISEPTRLLSISYAVFCLKKKK